MKGLKKILAIVLSLLVVFAIISACVAKADGVPSVTFSTNVEVKKSVMVTVLPDGTTAVSDVTANVVTYDKAEEGSAIKTKLDSAYNEIIEVSNVAELVPALDSIAKELNPKYNASVYSPVALFEASIDNTIPEGGYVALTFDLGTGFKFDEYGVIHKNEETGKWIACNNSDINVNADGTIEVYFDSFCPVAILGVNPSNLKVDASIALYTVIGIEALAIVFLLGTIIRPKKKENK